MNICLPYTAFINDLFRCLFHDLGIAFTQAPQPGRYTRQIGKSYAAGTLCPGLEEVLGSLTECRYLGADTAVVFAPCGGCSAERIGAKLSNCMEENGVSLRLVTLSPEEASQKAFWKLLRQESNQNTLIFRECKRRFTECCALLCQLLTAKARLAPNETSRRYVKKVFREIEGAETLLGLKIVLSLYSKRFRVLPQKPAEPPLSKPRLPYADGDYFHLGTQGSEPALFFATQKGAVLPALPPPKCPVNGDKAVFLTVQP